MDPPSSVEDPTKPTSSPRNRSVPELGSTDRSFSAIVAGSSNSKTAIAGPSTQSPSSPPQPIAGVNDVELNEEVIEGVNSGQLDLAAISKEISRVDTKQRLSYSKDSKFPWELFVYRGQDQVSLFNDTDYRTFMGLFDAKFVDKILENPKLDCQGSFLSGGVARFLCNDQLTHDTIKQIVNALTSPGGGTYRAYSRSEKGSFFRMTFTLKEPITLSDKQMEKVLNAQNNLNGGLNVLASTTEHWTDPQTNVTVESRRYHVRVLSSVLHNLKTKQGTYIRAMTHRPARLILSRALHDKKKTTATPDPLASMKVPPPKVTGKPKPNKNTRVVDARWALPLEDAHYWRLTKQERKQVRKAYAAQGRKFPHGERPPTGMFSDPTSKTQQRGGKRKRPPSKSPAPLVDISGPKSVRVMPPSGPETTVVSVEDTPETPSSTEASGSSASKSWADQVQENEDNEPQPKGPIPGTSKDPSGASSSSQKRSKGCP